MLARQAALRPVLTAALATEPGQFVLAVTATAREAEDLTAALGSFLPTNRVVCFPGWETLPHERLSPRSDTVGQRLAVLRRLAHPDPGDEAAGPLSVVVAPVRCLLQPISSRLSSLSCNDAAYSVTTIPERRCARISNCRGPRTSSSRRAIRVMPRMARPDNSNRRQRHAAT